MSNSELGKTTWTEDDFIKAKVERFDYANSSPKILAFWPHGHETLGPRVGYHIASERPDLLDHVDYLAGNPRAAALDPPKRDTGEGGSDLNRSFDPKSPEMTYEETRAQEVLSQIALREYDYVLDLHTTLTRGDPYMIIAGRNEAVDRMIAASPYNKIVVMPEHISRLALIGRVKPAVSIEYNHIDSDDHGLEEVLSTIDHLVGNVPLTSNDVIERTFYFVERTVSTSEEIDQDFANFTRGSQGYYPILFGDNTYKSDPSKRYHGFAAFETHVESL